MVPGNRPKPKGATRTEDAKGDVPNAVTGDRTNGATGRPKNAVPGALRMAGAPRNVETPPPRNPRCAATVRAAAANMTVMMTNLMASERYIRSTLFDTIIPL